MSVVDIHISTIRKEGGFTLLEILLVTGIIAILVAVIVPQAIRINTNSKYSIVEQAAAEIGKWGMEWGTRNLESQDAADTCVLNDYINTLSSKYIGDQASNWVNNTTLTTPGCRNNPPNTPPNPISYSVADMIDPGRRPRNPFNGVNYFSATNDGNTLYSGLLYLAVSVDTTTTPSTDHYYFVYTGTGSLNSTQWHGGMGQGTNPSLANLRNGIFMARLVQ